SELLNITYRLAREQADWLFGNAQHDAAAFWFEQLAGERFDRVRSQMEQEFESNADVRLGHCYLRLGRLDDAARLWEDALRTASPDKGSEFAYNLGHVRVRQGRWEDALQLYQQAAEDARSHGDIALMAEILFVMARLRARQGHTEQALQELNRSLRLIERVYKGHVRQAQAFVYAGDIYRYAEDIVQAEKYYEEALKILQQREKERWYDWQVQVLAGLGAVRNLSGVLKRERWQDIGGDIEDQKRAFEHFRRSLNMLRQYNVRRELMRVLDWLADVYLELHALEQLSLNANQAQELASLRGEMNTLDLAEEQTWWDVVRESGVPFQDLDTAGKAQRLFEVAFLHSEEQGEPHLMFYSLVRAAATAQLRGRVSDLEHYAALARTLGQQDDPRQETLFFALLDMLRAHIGFDEDPHRAVQQYGSAGKALAEGGSFGMALFRSQASQIERRLLSQPAPVARELCRALEKAWENQPFLLNFVQEIQDLLLVSGRE
ncbi:tetratricopeptide repeat protein, partial [Candidatus Parcubacteria bacterium]